MQLGEPAYRGRRLPGRNRRRTGASGEAQADGVSTYVGAEEMPWTPDEAERHTHKATTTELKELWAKVANESLQRNGDEGRAIREANAVVARQAEAGR